MLHKISHTLWLKMPYIATLTNYQLIIGCPQTETKHIITRYIESPWAVFVKIEDFSSRFFPMLALESLISIL